MRVEVQDLNEVEKILKVQIPVEKVNEVIEKVTKNLRKNAKIRGFRKGKVPPYLIKKLFKEEIQQRSIEELIDQTLSEAVKEAKLEPLLRPKIENIGELKEGDQFSYSVLVEVRPEINLKREDYIGIEVEKEKDEVSEEEVENILQELRYTFSDLKKVDTNEGIQERYIAVIKFSAYDNDKLIPGHQADALFVDVGTGEFNQEIEKALIGKKIGDKFTIEIEYPEDGLNPLLAGKKVRYEIEIKEVYKRDLKELTDEFVKNLNLGFESVEKLRERVKKRLLEEKKISNQSKMREKLLEKILEKTDFKVPTRYVDLKLMQLLDRVKESLEKDGLSFEKLNLSMDKLMERLKPVAEKQAKEELLLEKIAELENIEIPSEEIEKEIKVISKNLKVSEDKAKAIVYFNILPKKLAAKVLKFLEENAKIIEKEN
ncbi:MAG: trigger factor [Thermodesulfobacteriota bacterium]|nr:MAG: trigger factor [Thermodesulfobacteriota bacterium]